ncbi:MAG: lipopolysaccharide transport periplasmic protein LptA [Pseudomonadota bacterium]
MAGNRIGLLAGALGLLAGAALAQDNNSPFGSFQHDSTLPIEVTADALEVDQGTQSAVFSGNVVAGQDTLRLTAERVTIFYDTEAQDSETGAIQRLVAEGDVFLSNGSEQSTGDRAEYDVASGQIVMEGNVILTQGENALACDRLDIDLNGGTGRCAGQAGGSGRVSATFQPSQDGN